MIVGRFELKRVLGEGAQASVWLGFDKRLEREVAVKLMRADAAADPVAVDNWLREARSVSRPTHFNIVPVFEADMHGSQPYLAFEYVPGPTLAHPSGPWRVAVCGGLFDGAVGFGRAHPACRELRERKP